MSTDGGRGVRAALSGLKRGEAYTVRWRATSADGHTGSGVYTFGIGVTPPPPTEAYGSTGPGWADDAARWAFFVALALLLGTTGFRLLVLREPLPSRLSNRLYGIAAAGGIAVLNVGIAAFVHAGIRRAAACRSSICMYGDLSPLATKTRFGVAFVAMTLGYAIVTALVLLAWILDRPAAALAGVPDRHRLRDGALAVGTSGRRAELDVPDRARRLAPPRRRDSLGRRPPGARDLRLAARADAAQTRIPRLLAHRDRPRRGARACRHLPLDLAPARALRSLDDAATGTRLIVKIAIVCVALSWGAVHHFFVAPRLERGEMPGALRRSLIGESTVAILVLLVAAVLVNAKPPAVNPGGGTARRAGRARCSRLTASGRATLPA